MRTMATVLFDIAAKYVTPIAEGNARRHPVLAMMHVSVMGNDHFAAKSNGEEDGDGLFSGMRTS